MCFFWKKICTFVFGSRGGGTNLLHSLFLSILSFNTNIRKKTYSSSIPFMQSLPLCSFPALSKRVGLAHILSILDLHPVHNCVLLTSISQHKFQCQQKKGGKKSSLIPFCAMRSVEVFPFLVSIACLGCMIWIRAYSIHCC